MNHIREERWMRKWRFNGLFEAVRAFNNGHFLSERQMMAIAKHFPGSCKYAKCRGIAAQRIKDRVTKKEQ